MRKVSYIFLPVWMGVYLDNGTVTHDDLVDLKKLYGILSPRDVDLYVAANFEACNILANHIPNTELIRSDLHQRHNLVIESFSNCNGFDTELYKDVRNQSLMTKSSNLMFGYCNTAANDLNWTLSGTVLPTVDAIILRPTVINDGGTALQTLARSVTTLLGLEAAAATGIFQQYARSCY